MNLAWMQQKINSQNVANIETPGYKSKSLSFDSVLREAENGGKEISRINVRVESSDAVSNRPDGNNVDLETESIALYKAYAQYSMLLSKLSTEFEKYNSVLNANM